ncbi:CLOCK-interacting pacemaker [Stigmatopora argus]
MSAKRKVESEPRAAARPRLSKSHGASRADSERDSGFSDASSEHTGTTDNTDSEDSSRPGSRLSVVGGSYSGVSPMIVVNNVLLKQPRDEGPPAVKSWSFSPGMEMVRQPQVVFLQPVVSRKASKETSRHRRLKKYLPILKSYPKIAPYPGNASSSSGRGSASSSSSATAPPREPGQGQVQVQVAVLSTGRDEAAPLPSATEDDSDGDSRRKRFCNTYNILSKSGLLDITLRTKELLRQNRRTQTELDRLREHTRLFVQALHSGDATLCLKLLASLQEEEDDDKRAPPAASEDDWISGGGSQPD